MQIPHREWEPFPQIGERRPEEEHRRCGRLGGKGANLHRLHHAGFAVPTGFIVPVEVFRAALAAGTETHLLRLAEELGSAGGHSPADLALRHPEWRPLLEQLRPPLHAALAAAGIADCWLAVRSSGTLEDGQLASYAGVLESFLGVAAEHLAEAVVLCWASAFTRRCREYSEAIGLDPDDMAVAVIVQPVLPAAVSGIIHTRDPLTDRSEIVIEAVRGLNHVACDGNTSPEILHCRRFGCKRQPGNQPWQEVLSVSGIRRVSLAEAERSRPVLTASQRHELVGLARRVEKLLGGPQDIEWTLAQGRIWLLQARPVTAGANSRVWTRANLRELYPEVVAPLTGSLIRRLQQCWYVDYFAGLGFDVRHLGPGMRVVRGRPYLNLSLLRCLAESAGVDGARVEAKIGSDAATPSPGTVPDWRRALKTGWPLLRITRRYLRAARSSHAALAGTYRTVAAMQLPDAVRLEDRELMDGALRCFRALQPLYDATADVAGAIETMDILSQAIPGLDGDGTRADPQRSGHSDSREVHEFARLIRLAHEEPEVRLRFLTGHGPDLLSPAAFRGTWFGAALEQYLADYGFRALYESDSSVPRYHEDPRPLLAAIQSGLRGGAPARSPREEPHAGAELSTTKRRTVTALCARWLGNQRARLLTQRQEIRKGTSQLIAQQRRWESALARRWAERGWIDRAEDFWWLPLDEIEAALADPILGESWLRTRVRRRRARAEDWAAEPMPIYWPRPAAAVTSPAPRKLADREVLRGLPVSPGVVEGRVKLVLRPEDAFDLEPGCILVAPFAGPAWAPFFATARGLVVELGGSLSHSAILAREYGLPAVANVAEVTRLFRNGDLIRIDGGSGQVWRLTAAAPASEREPLTVPSEWSRGRSRSRRGGECRAAQETSRVHQEAA